MSFFTNFPNSRLIAAHRGFRAYHPENTLSSFLAALGRCHFIELDVQFSKDYVPMVIHDPTLARTTNAAEEVQFHNSKSMNVMDWSVAELKTLDFGSWFLDVDPFGALRRGDISREELSLEMPQRILTLEELLTHPQLQKIPLNIEIKNQEVDTIGRKLTEKVLDIIIRNNAQARVLLSSFNHDYLVQAKSRLPGLTTGALQENSHPEDLVTYLRHLQVSAYHPDDEITDRQVIHELSDAGFAINIYTVNSRKRQAELFDFGATTIITDFPELP